MTRRTLLGGVTAVFLTTLPLAAAAADIVVSDAWSRPAIDTGVVYLTIRNTSRTGDVLLRARSPLARAVELHETMTMPMAGMADMMSMHERKRIPIAAAGVLRFRPGGYHIMLIGLRRPLQLGMRVPIILTFARAGDIAAVSRVIDRVR
jgi:copper(I)-binding protein